MKTKQWLRVSKLERLHNDYGGCAVFSDFYPHVTRKKVNPPAFCEVMRIGKAAMLPGVIGRRARRIERHREHCKWVVVITDLRKARDLLRETGRRVDTEAHKTASIKTERERWWDERKKRQAAAG